MLTTIAFATAVVAGHPEPNGMYMFAAVFPQESAELLIAMVADDEARTCIAGAIDTCGGADKVQTFVGGVGLCGFGCGDPDAIESNRLFDLFSCLWNNVGCQVQVIQNYSACVVQCGAKYGCVPSPPDICEDCYTCNGNGNSVLFADCVDCCEDVKSGDTWQCLFDCGDPPPPANSSHCWAPNPPPPDPPPFDEDPIVPRLITGDLTDPEVP